MSKTVKISISNITGFKNPKVVFLDSLPSCVSRNCELKPGDTEFEIKIEDGCTGVCIEGYIYDDGCADCPAVPFKRCLSDDGTCPDGQKYVDGFCIDICSEDDIKAGKLNLNGVCQCPADKPFYDENQEKCVQCESGTTHPTNKCLECVNGFYRQKECDGTCIPETGDCVPNCPPASKYNPITKKCECLPGFYEDVNGNCIAEPPTCGPCEDLVNGECRPVVCPNPDQVCVNDECVDKPCEGDCENGLDCTGKNCGCDENIKKCVDCTENPNALGCDDDGNCSGACSGPEGCPGDDCGCYQGECVSCDNFPCGTCGDVAGCGCTDGVNCEGDDADCEDDLELEIDGCNLVGTLTKKDFCQCEGINSAVVTSNYKETDNLGVSTPPITGLQFLAGQETDSTFKIDFEVDIRKGIATSYAAHKNLSLFSNATIHNELPTNGTVELKVTKVYRDVETNEVLTLAPQFYTKTLENKSVVNFTDIEIGNTVLDADGLGSLALGYNVEVKIKDLEFENSCVYKDTVIYESANTEIFGRVGFIGLNKILSGSSRNPLFTWKRGDITFRSLFKKPQANGEYVDTLYGPKKFTGPGVLDGQSGEQTLMTPEGELISLQDYTLDVDCSCDKQDVKEQLVICDIEFELDKNFRLDKCNKQILLDDVFDVCPINQDLNAFGWGNNHPSQSRYILKINGNVEATFIYDNSLNTLIDQVTGVDWTNWEKTFDDEITSASLELNHSDACKVVNNFTLTLPVPKIELDCEQDGTITATIFNTVGPEIESVKVAINNVAQTRYMTGSSVTFEGLTKGESHTFMITYEGGCVKEFVKIDNCCEQTAEIFVQENIQGAIGSNRVNVNYTVTGLSSPRTVTLNGVTQNDTGVVNVSSGSYVLRVTDGTGCDKSVTFVVPEIEDDSTLDFDINPICTGGTSSLEITGPINTAFTVRLPSGGQSTGVTNATGTAVINGLSAAGTYTLETLGGNLVNTTVELEVIEVLDVTSISLAAGNTNCTGSTVKVNIIGTPNALVSLTALGATGDTSVQLNSNGFGQAQLTYGFPGTFTITASSISLNGICSTPINDSINITINSSPSINDVQFECVSLNSGPSDVVVTVVAQTGLTVTGNVSGTVYNFTPTSSSNIYEVTIPAASGQTIVVTAANGSCEDTSDVLLIEQCDCPNVNPPNVGSQSIYYTCANGTVTATVTPALNTTVKWFSDATLVNQIATGNSYTTSVEGTYYAAGFDLNDCPSSPVSVTVVNGNYTLSVPAINDTCLGEQVVITANILGNSDQLQYLFRIDGNIVQTWGSSNTYSYTPTTIGSKSIEVETRRNGACFDLVALTANVVDCCTAPQTISLVERFVMPSGGSYAVDSNEAGGGTNCSECAGNNPPFAGQIQGIPVGEQVTVAVSGNVTMNSAAALTVGSPVLLCYNNTSDPNFSATITITYCNQDYVFDITPGNCP